MPILDIGTAPSSGAVLPTLAISGGGAIAEGASGGTVFSFALTLTRNGSTGAVPYSWAVTGAGADAADFVGGTLPSGSGTFATGETVKTISVSVAGDTAYEGDEGLVVTATASLPLAAVTATATILNDDSAPPAALLMGSRLNQMGFGGYTGSNGTDTDSNSRIASYNETGATVTKLRAYFANWFANSTNEQDGYNAITVTAAVEYPSGTFTALAFGGSASVSIAASGTSSLAESDEATVSIPAGAQYWVRTYVSVASGGKWPQGYLIATALGETADFATATDRTQSGTITNATATTTRRGYGPVAVKATGFTGTPVTKAFAAIGDSLIMGSSDTADPIAGGHGNVGYLAKAAAGYYPVANLGIAGTAASGNLSANMGRRLNLLAKIGITHVFADWSINDTSAGRTSAQQQADIAAIAAAFKTAMSGVKVVWATQTPYTTGTYLTAAGQTIKSTPSGAFTGGASSVRGQINAAIRSGITNVDTVFDAAAPVEVNAYNALTQNGGYWISGNGGTGATSSHLTTSAATTDAATSDGLHPATLNTASPQYGGVYILRDSVRAAFSGW